MRDDRHPDLDSVLAPFVDGQEFLLIGRVGSLNAGLEHLPGRAILLKLGLQPELLDLALIGAETGVLGRQLVALGFHRG